MSSEDKIREGAQPSLGEGESLIAAFVARPRGWTQASAGVRGETFRLEVGAGAYVKGLVQAFEETRQPA